MNYQSVADTAKSWNVSERTVRNYCATGKIPGAVLIGKTWNVPQDAERPERINKKQQAPRTLLTILQDEMTGMSKAASITKSRSTLPITPTTLRAAACPMTRRGISMKPIPLAWKMALSMWMMWSKRPITSSALIWSSGMLRSPSTKL